MVLSEKNFCISATQWPTTLDGQTTSDFASSCLDFVVDSQCAIATPTKACKVFPSDVARYRKQ